MAPNERPLTDELLEIHSCWQEKAHVLISILREYQSFRQFLVPKKDFKEEIPQDKKHKLIDKTKNLWHVDHIEKKIDKMDSLKEFCDRMKKLFQTYEDICEGKIVIGMQAQSCRVLFESLVDGDQIFKFVGQPPASSARASDPASSSMVEGGDVSIALDEFSSESPRKQKQGKGGSNKQGGAAKQSV